MTKPTKSDLIRKIAESEPTISNERIKDVCLQVYGLDVESNLISNVLGPEKERVDLTRKIPAAQRFSSLVGGFRNAINLVHRVKRQDK
jgi:hypothetical protein